MDQQIREFILKAHKIKHSLSNPASKEEIVAAIEMGMIPKANLKDGCYYLGTCRGAPVARWNAGLGKFQYLKDSMRWISLDKPIPHPEDDDGFDFFVPVLCLSYSKNFVAE